MILILSNKWDLTVDFVVRELYKRNHPFLRLNTEDLISSKATICLPELRISLSNDEKVWELTKDLNAVWYRRPGLPFDDFPKNEKPPLATQRFVAEQWAIWIEALQLIPGITWVNHPDNNNRMENKIRQLLLASELGFNIPETIASNDPNEVFKQADRYGGDLVTKALYAPLIEETSQDYFIFTNRIDLDDLKGADEALKISPSIFQRVLSPKIDYRVTVIGKTVFAVKVEVGVSTTEETPIDWRTIKDDINFTPVDLPPDIEEMCRQYLKVSNLHFGAIDLIESGGFFYFIEINPNGEWGWLQKPNNVPIAQALCDLLISFDRAGSN